MREEIEMTEAAMRQSGPVIFTVTMQDGGVREDCLLSLYNAREALWHQWADPCAARIKSIKIRLRDRR